MKTVFIRAVGAPVDEKASVLRDAIRGQSAARFEEDVTTFSQIQRSPFAYWIGDGIRRLFADLAPFASGGRVVKQGLATADDFRFLRLWSEVDPFRFSGRWFAFAKGGRLSPFYADVYLVVNWEADGSEIKNNLNDRGGVRSNVWMLRDTAATYFFQPGLTYPARPHSTGWFAAVPAGCIFGHNGPMVFVKRGCELAWLAMLNSRVYHFLVQLMMSRGQGGSGQTLTYEVGMVAATPVPALPLEAAKLLADRARRSWSLKRRLDTTNEISHAFILPPGPNEKLTRLDPVAIERELASLQREIDDRTFALYGISPEDRATIEASAKGAAAAASSATDASDEPNDNDASEEDDTPVGAPADTLLSWLVGVAFGRFDPRLATGERAIPPEPEPFDPLPARSPGMYPEGEEPADRPDILVDDEGHADDLAARTIAIAERVNVDAPENLRAWLAKEFFPLHIKMYSKSRRKAPIYWQLATSSASYSVWLYLHAFSKDTLFRVQNDYVAPKVAHEERRLESLTGELRDGATAAQRKQLAAQEALVEELRAFLDEVKRVTPLWNPNLDDGVIINFAPLWRLVPQHNSWQKELKSTWDALCEGKYDWAHLAMHLWPERVVAKCAKDRSLAIAHGLEEVFWVEGTDGKWTARKTPTKSVDELVKERTSPAVRSALKSLLEAPAASGAAKKTRKGKANA